MEKLKCVLIVDDDHISNLLTRKIFEALNCAEHVEITNSTVRTMEFIKEYHLLNHTYPELIFIDVHMPEKNGFDLYREIKTARLENFDVSRTVMITASCRPQDRLKFMEHGVGYIEKPFSIEKLLPFLQGSNTTV